MESNVLFDTAIREHTRQEVLGSLECVRLLCKPLGGLAINSTKIDKPIALDNFVSNEKEMQLKFLGQYPKDQISLYITEQSIIDSSGWREQGLSVANFAVVSTIEKNNSELWMPTIHETGHMLGLVQPEMPNAYGKEHVANHCSQFSCIMSTRPTEFPAELRYYHYKSEPDKVFCKDCQNYLENITELTELPWYNQV